MSFNNPVALQPAQPLCKDFGRDAGEVAVKLGEAAVALVEIPDYLRGPRTRDEADTLTQRIALRRRRHVALSFLDHDPTYQMVTPFCVPRTGR